MSKMIEYLIPLKWIDEQSDTLISLYKKGKRLFGYAEPVAEESTVASRFISLFVNHGVHRNQIPKFFDHGLSLNDVETIEKLLPKLTPEILQAAADLFAVRIEWLECVDKQIYEIHDFYKQPEAYAEFLTQLVSNKEHRVFAKLVWSTNLNCEYDAVLVLEEQFDYLGNGSVSRYHVCGGWVNKYWKSRADLTACVAITLKQLGHIKGFQTSASIEPFSEGEGFVYELYSLPYAYKRDWLFRKRFEMWDPASWTYDPNAFLDRVDRDWDSVGKARAIEKWLYYFDKGLMDTGYHPENVRSEFEKIISKV